MVLAGEMYFDNDSDDFIIVIVDTQAVLAVKAFQQYDGKKNGWDNECRDAWTTAVNGVQSVLAANYFYNNFLGISLMTSWL